MSDNAENMSDDSEIQSSSSHLEVKEESVETISDDSEHDDSAVETKESTTKNDQEKINEFKENNTFGGYASIEEFTKSGYAAIMKATRTVNAFPQGTARDFYCSYPTFGKIIDEKCSDMLKCISKVLKSHNIKGNIQNRTEDERFELLQECNDIVMERLKTNLEEYGGLKKTPKTVIVESKLNSEISSNAGSWNLNRSEETTKVRLITAKNIARPQILFRVPVDNSAKNVFIPKIKEKPNSLKPLSILPEYNEDGDIVSYVHPYEFELLKFQTSNNELKSQTPNMPSKQDDINYVYVDTLSVLQKAVEELRKESVIAIDVEHHSYRSYLGFTCLVQISSRTKDYLFDALNLREDLYLLNEITTNPKVIKVLHGATMDIEWLQRDLGVYIVNMFDTYQGAKLLNFSRLSLAFLLKHYCDIDADKTFQLADWRIRPLPEELVAYARQDTHYLIYIFECLVNDLIDASNDKSNLIRVAYDRSTDLCKIRYIKPAIDEDSYMDLFRKSNRNFDNRQLFAMREIFNWRDALARQDDESCSFILPNHMLVQIAESLPREMQGILACCNPVPPLVRQNLQHLHRIVLKARAEPLIKPILADATKRTTNYINIEYNKRLYCPHDLTNRDEFRDDLPLFNGWPDYTNIKLKKPAVSSFQFEQTKRKSNLEDLRETQLPYQRYLKILPVIEKEKLEEQTRTAEANKLRKLCPDAPTIKLNLDDNIPSTSRNINKGSTADNDDDDDDDDPYKLPIKKQLKRLHEESIAKKSAKTDSPAVKRQKIETTTNNEKLKFVEMPNVIESKKKDPKDKHKSLFSIDINTSVEETETSNKDRNAKSFRNDNKKKFKNKKRKPSHVGQSSNQQVNTNFKYYEVDFKRFQGGAQRSKGIEVNSQSHAKNNNAVKNNNKKLNKLFTFSNVKSNKK